MENLRQNIEIKKSILPAIIFILFSVLLVFTHEASAKGRKFGLFVGINKYPEGIQSLSGCVNDAKKLREAMVSKFGFKIADTTLLTDSAATRDGIIGKIKMYEQLVGEGDLFVFHYSGHGSLFPDKYSEEQDEKELVYFERVNSKGGVEVLYPRDKYDSAIVPVDAPSKTSGKPWQNLILDDELYAMFSAFTKKGAQIVFISDSCHSGSIARASEVNSGIKHRFTPLQSIFRKESFDDIKLKDPDSKTVKTDPPQLSALYIALTAAATNETAGDGNIGGVKMGLFTAELLKTLNEKSFVKATYAQLVKSVGLKVKKVGLKYKFNQNPQLDARFGDPNNVIFQAPILK